MMYYFTENGDGRKITIERSYVVRDDNGFIIGRGGSLATAIMDTDGLTYEEAHMIETCILEESKERRF